MINRNVLKKSAAVLLGINMFSLMLTGCSSFNPADQVESLGGKVIQTSTIFAMDTVMELQIYGDAALLNEAQQKIADLENTISVTNSESDIGKLNAAGVTEVIDGKNYKSAEISAVTAQIMERALKMCERTDGALDISIYPVVKTWGFTTGEYKVPTDRELSELLKEVDYTKVVLAEDGGKNTICKIPENMQVDLGSVAKGYTSQMLTDYFTEKGITSGLINLGGNVQCIGSKPNNDKWKVAIKSPFSDSKSGILGVLEASDVAIITSGGYERFFEEDGKIYWHIIDPDDGRPTDNGIVSVTIVGKDGFLCDALSTALFVKGLEKAISFWQQSDDFDAVFVTKDGTVYVTQGIADSFTLSSEYYNAEKIVLTK